MAETKSIPAEWVDALDRIQRQLDQNLASLAEPLPSSDPEPSGENPSREIRERLQQRLEMLDGRVVQSREHAQLVEMALARETEALQNWLNAAARAREQIAQMTSRSIS